MCLLIVAIVIGVSTAQFIPTPPGFQLVTAMGQQFGSSGYITIPKNYSGLSQYLPGARSRCVVVCPYGSTVNVNIDMTDTNNFGIRAYDFAVMYDGNYASSLSSGGESPCNVASYQHLGPSGIAYQSVVMANVSNSRSFNSFSNQAVIDFCANPFNSGSDRTMVGLRARWACMPPTVTTTTTRTTPTTTTTTSRTTSATTISPSNKICGKPKSDPANNLQRIVGGVGANLYSWPFACAIVDITYQPAFQFCDCSIIADKWIMTAGHCVASKPDSYFTGQVRIYYGSPTQNLQTALKASIGQVFRNPNYDTPKDSTSNDVALFKLTGSLQNFNTIDGTVMPICLPDAALGTFQPALLNATTGRSIAFVAGWGTLYQGQSAPLTQTQIASGNDQLQVATVDIFSRQECTNAYGSTFPTSTICGGLNEGLRDSCQGDSGGPLIMRQRDGTYAQFGIVSFGYGCALKGYPGAYSDVFYLKDFISKTMANNP